MAKEPKIAVIGEGNVGSAIRKGAESAGYEVRATGSDPKKVKELGTWGDIIVLAVPYGERFDALDEVGDVDGKVLVDVTNALGDEGFVGSIEKSGAEEIQEKAEGARVVKAFNTVFAQNMATGKVDGERITLLAAGDHEDAKQTVLGLGAAIGFHAVDAGPLENARWLETMGYLLIRLGYGLEYGADMGFKLVGAPAAKAAAEPVEESQTAAGA